MITVPVGAMVTIDSLPSSFIERFPEGSSKHCILAAWLTHGDPSLVRKLENWRKVWPSRKDFADCMPILWPERLRVSTSACQFSDSSQSLLPPCASGLWNSFAKKQMDMRYETRHQYLLAQQEKRLQEAWRNTLSAFPNTDWDMFSYYWLILNTRSFFYVSPKRRALEDRNDAVSLVPFADYFNHVDDAVS